VSARERVAAELFVHLGRLGVLLVGGEEEWFAPATGIGKEQCCLAEDRGRVNEQHPCP
jgi:hypothetical protein